MTRDDWLLFPRTAVAAAVAVVACATTLPALAQNTTSAITGRVLAADGKPVAGATVTILHVDSGTSVSATTDGEGRYAARGLRPGGPYTITFTRGSDVDRREGVFLALAETTALDGLVGVVQTITVTGRASSDRFNSGVVGAGTNIGSRELNALASVQRNLQDYARQDPRLAQTDKERGEISALGQNTRFNSITIDGVTTNDTFGLESNNLPTLKQPISIDAIQSVQVNLSNYDVTQKGYTGANINAVTKSGTNEFTGSLYYVTRDESLVGKRFNRTTGAYFDAPAFEESTVGFTLGGPIIKDKLFFFASYEELTSSRNSPSFGPLGSSATNVGITSAAITEAQRIARDVWGFDTGGSAVPQGLELSVKDTLLKLDWNITDSHRASLRYTKTEQDDPVIAGFSGTGLSLSSWWWNQAKTLESVVGQWFADWTPDFSTELKLSTRDYESVPIQNGGGGLPAVGLRFSGAAPGAPAGFSTNNRFLNFGTENSRQLNALATETVDLYAGANWNLGDHELKFGLDYSDNEVYNAFVQNVNGNYTFGCEPGSYSFGTVANCTGNYTPTGATDPVAMTPELRDQAVLENFARGTPSAFTLQAPRGSFTLNDAVAIWSYKNTGLFVQDTWRVSPALSVTLGLRMDQQNVPTRPRKNDDVAAAAVTGSTDGTTFTRATGGFGADNTVTLDGNRLWQPRVGFNLDLGTRENRRQLRGGLGLFQGAAANVWLSNPFSNTGIAVAQLNCGSFTNCSTRGVGGSQIVFSPNPATQPTLTGEPPAPNVDLISSGLEQPSVWKANLAFEAELPELPVVGRLVAGAEWVHSKVNSAIYYEHLNLGAVVRTGPDGRDLYYRAEGYNQACWNPATGAAITSGACATPSGQSRTRALSNNSFSNVLLAKETSRGGGDAVTLSLASPSRSGLSWSMAYTYTTAKEVSPLTSSTSGSNWSNRNIFNQNEDVEQNSNYLIRDRVNASLVWSKAFVGKYNTTVGMFYEGRKGKPYSWTYINDLNGDGIGGNDLMYIPANSGDVIFRGADGTVGGEASVTAEARFWDVVNSSPALSSARGGVVGRNNEFAPWVNTVDLRVSQELPGFISGHKGSITFDILNFGNLLNKEWGRIDEIGFPSNRSFVYYNGIDPATGRYIYSMGSTEDLATRQNAGESQWAVQVTLRYSF
jgi:hypothetical protein